MNGQDTVEGDIPERKDMRIPMEKAPPQPPPRDPVWKVRTEPHTVHVSTPQPGGEKQSDRALQPLVESREHTKVPQT